MMGRHMIPAVGLRLATISRRVAVATTRGCCTLILASGGEYIYRYRALLQKLSSYATIGSLGFAGIVVLGMFILGFNHGASVWTGRW